MDMPFAQRKFVPATLILPAQTKRLFRVTAPVSSAAAQVMSLNTLPGSYKSEIALLRHWACWAVCKALLRSSPLSVHLLADGFIHNGARIVGS